MFTVRACYNGATIAPCHWLVERTHWNQDPETGEWWGGEDGPVVEDCGAEAVYDDHGYACSAGHSHVHAEVRYAQGWDYAEDDGEAARLVKAGVIPVRFDGSGAY